MKNERLEALIHLAKGILHDVRMAENASSLPKEYQKAVSHHHANAIESIIREAWLMGTQSRIRKVFDQRYDKFPDEITDEGELP